MSVIGCRASKARKCKKLGLSAPALTQLNNCSALDSFARELMRMPSQNRVWVAATIDTKSAEAEYLCGLLEKAALSVALADVSTSGNITNNARSSSSIVRISPVEIASYHTQGKNAVFTGDRGSAVAAMTEAFERFVQLRDDIGAMLGIGGSGGTALISRGMRALPIGVPKLIVSTMASGNVSGYVGPSDITMMYSVTDMAGLNRISRRVLGNAAYAVAGMMSHSIPPQEQERPALGLTMFGVTTPCVQQISMLLNSRFDCLVFHATGTGGQSMEKLLDDGYIGGVLDITTTEVCDHLMGGVLPCTSDRFGAVARTRAPYLGSCGALDMVNFAAPETVPERYRGRNFYPHNPQITLMRTTIEENIRQARWIAERLNRCEGRVIFLLPMGGVSALDAPGKSFWDPAADAALFETLASGLRQTERRKLVRVPCHINDPLFAETAVKEFLAIAN